MQIIDIVSDGYKMFFGVEDIQIVALPQSGSDRKYFRIYDGKKSIIGAYNANPEENAAFTGFTAHFLSKGLPVPEIYGIMSDQFIYFLRDLGDNNLYTWLQTNGFKSEAEELYRKVLDTLISFQMEGIKGLDLELCYPHKSFDRQSMMWDMNYFKYMLLKLLAAPFNERRLENDFDKMSDFLLETGQDYFLYRDFQSANVMVVDGEPWFIDYQGGRKGAPQYDVASLLYDAKAHVPAESRKRLLDYYVENFCLISGENKDEFRGYYAGFSMIRLMQALGAFGFRGLYEKKPTFTGSIVPAIELLTSIIDSGSLPIDLPELFTAVRNVPSTGLYKNLKEDNIIA
ncbi:MAG TPA: phosphotransferase [Bacteroidales bacterium]|nr:phosphotransferase [Bacteroidales bacterium]